MRAAVLILTFVIVLILAEVTNPGFLIRVLPDGIFVENVEPINTALTVDTIIVIDTLFVPIPVDYDCCKLLLNILDERLVAP